MAKEGFWGKLFNLTGFNHPKDQPSLNSKQIENHGKPPKGSYQLKQYKNIRLYKCFVCHARTSNYFLDTRLLEKLNKISPKLEFIISRSSGFVNDPSQRTLNQSFISHSHPSTEIYNNGKINRLYVCHTHQKVCTEFIDYLHDLDKARYNINEEISGLFADLDYQKEDAFTDINNRIEELPKHHHQTPSSMPPTSNSTEESIQLFILQETKSMTNTLIENIIPSFYNLLELTGINSNYIEFSEWGYSRDTKLVTSTNIEKFLKTNEGFKDNQIKQINGDLMASLWKLDVAITTSDLEKITSFKEMIIFLIDYLEKSISGYFYDLLEVASFIPYKQLENCFKIFEDKTNPVILFPALDQKLLDVIHSYSEDHGIDLTDEVISRREIIDDAREKVTIKLEKSKLNVSTRKYIDITDLESMNFLEDVEEYVSKKESDWRTELLIKHKELGHPISPSNNLAELEKMVHLYEQKLLKSLQKKALENGLSLANLSIDNLAELNDKYEQEYNKALGVLRSLAKSHSVAFPRIKALPKIKQIIDEKIKERSKRAEETLNIAKKYNLPMSKTSETNPEKLEKLFHEQYSIKKMELINFSRQLGMKTPRNYKDIGIPQMKQRIERHKRRTGFEKAGIPKSIIARFCNLEISEESVLQIAREFGREKIEISDYEDEILYVLGWKRLEIEKQENDEGEEWEFLTLDPREENFILADLTLDSRTNGDAMQHLVKLIKNNSRDVFDYAFKNSISKEEFDFILMCESKDSLKPLSIAILLNDFELKEAMELINDLSFGEHPEALEEVIAGADAKLIASKYQFFQI